MPHRISPASPEISPTSSQNNLTLPTEDLVDKMTTEITDQTSGLSVEQLEQVNSVMMESLWQTRGNWDRRYVLTLMVRDFNHALHDMQQTGQPEDPRSWEADSNGSMESSFG